MRLAAATVLMMFLANAYADEPAAYPIDDRFRDLENKLAENAQACAERASGGGRFCESSERQRLERSYPFRGTRQYVRHYYLPMETKTLLSTRDELRAQQKIARSQKDFWVDSPRPAGELTKEMLSFELGLIDNELDVRKRKGRQQLRNVTNDIKRALD